MSKGNIRRGASKADWLAAALEVLRSGGIDAVKVESLAKSLGIAKSGFYWHFSDRRELLTELLGFWTHETTEVITRNPQLRELDPVRRLERIAEINHAYRMSRYDVSMRQWALVDKDAARVVRKVTNERLDYIRQTLKELGFEDEDMEMRAMLFLGYHTIEEAIFPHISRKRRRDMIRRRVALITHPAPST